MCRRKTGSNIAFFAKYPTFNRAQPIFKTLSRDVGTKKKALIWTNSHLTWVNKALYLLINETSCVGLKMVHR